MRNCSSLRVIYVNEPGSAQMSPVGNLHSDLDTIRQDFATQQLLLPPTPLILNITSAYALIAAEITGGRGWVVSPTPRDT